MFICNQNLTRMSSNTQNLHPSCPLGPIARAGTCEYTSDCPVECTFPTLPQSVSSDRPCASTACLRKVGAMVVVSAASLGHRCRKHTACLSLVSWVAVRYGLVGLRLCCSQSWGLSGLTQQHLCAFCWTGTCWVDWQEIQYAQVCCHYCQEAVACSVPSFHHIVWGRSPPHLSAMRTVLYVIRQHQRTAGLIIPKCLHYFASHHYFHLRREFQLSTFCFPVIVPVRPCFNVENLSFLDSYDFWTVCF